MIKEGVVKDPAQKKLRQEKRQWNAKVNLWIKDLIEYKKLINGAPNKYFKQKTKITSPIPANSGVILDNLSSRFQELAQTSIALVQEQDQYAKNFAARPKKAPKGAVMPIPAPVASKSETDLTKQLIAEGSNPWSRFITKLKTRQSGFGTKAQENRLRMQMLDDALATYRLLDKFQVQIIRSGDDSIINSYNLANEAWQRWTKIMRDYNAYMITNSKSIAPDIPDHAGQEANEVPPVNNDVKILSKGKQLASSKAEEKTKAKAKAEKVKDASDEAIYELEAVSQAFLQKWLGQVRHSVLPGKNSATRLKLFQISKDICKEINKVMDILEKGLNPDHIAPALARVSQQMMQIRQLVQSLRLIEKSDKNKDL
jgi:hypothetical protein